MLRRVELRSGARQAWSGYGESGRETKGLRRRPQGEGKRNAGRVRRWSTAVALGAMAAAYAASPVDRAAAERPSPEQVEAAYLYNFGKFVRWPGMAPEAPLVLCVAGQDAVDQLLAQMVAGEQIEGRPLEVKRLQGTEGASSCSILFLGAGEQDWLETYLGAAAGKPVLTVGEAPDFLAHGGIIQFVLTGDHVRFSVNLGAARRSGLQLSSELLKVAVNVTGTPQMGGTP